MFLKSLTVKINGNAQQQAKLENIKKNTVERTPELKLAEVVDLIEYHRMKMYEAALLYKILNDKQSLN